MNGLDLVGRLPIDDFVRFVNGYRGVDRMYINYPTEYYGTDDPILKIYEKYEEVTTANLYFNDIEFARKLRDVYNRAYPQVQREIIEICFSKEDISTYNGKFLGFDIGCNGASNILRIILTFSLIKDYNRDELMDKLLVILAKSFSKKLNENQLFETYEEAKIVLDVIDGIFETFNKKSNFREFKVIKVFLVD